MTEVRVSRVGAIVFGVVALFVGGEDLGRAAAIATEKPLDNPEPVTEASIRRLLEDAYQGFEPSSL